MLHRLFLILALVCTSSVQIANAATTSCKISVVGGSWAGHSYPLKVVDGKFVTSGVKTSKLPGCVGKKYVYGRWYHLCSKGKIIVYKRKENRWKRLSAKSLKKYKHNCL